VWSEPMLAALERGLKGNKWFSLIDKVWSERTLQLAWEKVKSNAGACGADGITIGRFAKDSQSRLLAVKEQLKRNTYQPKPVKRVWIEKPGSAEKRPLGIPTVTDRVVQAAVRMVIEPIFENRFAKHSYGFRPGRGCKDALRRVEELLQAGHTHIVDVDIKGCFDAIPHDRLMALVRERLADGRVLGLIEGFLKQGVVEGNDWHEAKEEGTPQGGVTSPLLANIYLDPLDWLMAGNGFEMVRYADDMVVLCRSHEEAAAALSKLKEWMDGAGLTPHPDKTRTVDLNQAYSHFDFLGYRFQRSRRGRLMRLVRPRSQRKLREAIKSPRPAGPAARAWKPLRQTSTGRSKAGSDTSSTSIPASWVRLTNGCGCVCAPSCASGGAAEAVAGDRITIAGPTATSPGWGSSACWMPKSPKPPVSDKEQTTDWRAGCGRSARPIRRGERRKPMRRSYLYP
jgi:RNA-directed DNA polymerase